MGIAPISGLSSYGSIASVQPMNYAVENDADFSEVYTAESTKDTGGVNGTHPVQYPNAKVETAEETAKPVDPLERQKKALQVAGDFNDIAMKFAANTGYGMDAVGASYNMAGSRFDAYA